MGILFEMMYSKRKALDELSFHNKERIKSCIKLFVYFNRREFTIERCIREIYKCSGQSPRCRGNKQIKASSILKVIWRDIKDNYLGENLLFTLENFRLDGYPVISINSNNLEMFLEEFHIWLAEELSKRNIPYSVFADKLYQLINKYK